MNTCAGSLADADREVHAALERERERQAVEIDLILAAAGPDRDAAVRTARETVAMLTRDPGGDR